MSHPALEILVREPDSFSIWNGLPLANGTYNVKLDRLPCSSAQFSENGSRLLVINSTSTVSIYDCDNFTEITSMEIPFLLAAVISPCGTYLQTFQKPSTPQDKNLSLWKVGITSPVYRHFQKNMSKATWPCIKFCYDESVACRLATNEIQFFDSSDFSKGILYRLRIPDVSTMELSKYPGSHICTFVPESKGIPASVQIYSCDKEAQSQAVARRSFFRCSTVQFHWNHGSTGLLAVAQSDVDKTNQSYYGESKLSYLTTDGVYEGLVPLRKDGPIHDVQWSSSGTEFAVVYGFMPAKATIFDKKCNPLLELGTGPYNTIRWNPKGRFICLAGFGNLPGDMAFWDYSEKRCLGTTKAEWSVTSEWSPDGCYFLTATTAPRLQIDNGIKIFHHDGSLYIKKMFEKLYQVDWRPIAAEAFGDITDLIKSINVVHIDESRSQGEGQIKKQDGKLPQSSIKSAHTPIQKPAAYRPPQAPVQKPAAYRPPQAKQAAAVQAELLGRASSSEELSKNALRNKKRREKEREKKAAAAASASSDGS